MSKRTNRSELLVRTSPTPPALVAAVSDFLKRFLAMQATSGILLIVTTVLALIAANTGLSEAYHDLLHTPLTIGIGSSVFSRSLHFWINDGLMAIFFFAIGLEIKREALIGELASLKRSALPIAAALGGMIVPALIYVSLNDGGATASGWGIPMATDIAFAIGILSLLGDRVPTGLKVFLTALAIADDLGAVLVIAIFYTDTIVLSALGVAALGIGMAFMLNLFHIRHPAWYGLIGVVVWIAFLQSGVHPTIAGVLMGLTIPVRVIYDRETWMQRVEGVLQRYRKAIEDERADNHLEIARRQSCVHEIENVSEKAISPLIKLEHGLQPWIAFAIMPLFAFANAGVAISVESLAAAFGSMVTWGIVLGLFIGKQLGILAFSWLAVKLKLASLPDGIDWRQLYGVAILAGIGFTMSLFITELAFANGRDLIDHAKVGILLASLLSGVIGYIALRVGDDGTRSPSVAPH